MVKFIVSLIYQTLNTFVFEMLRREEIHFSLLIYALIIESICKIYSKNN
jgi:hypothetical protein